MFFFWSPHAVRAELLNLFRPHSAVGGLLEVISRGPIIQLHPLCTVTLFFFFFFFGSMVWLMRCGSDPGSAPLALINTGAEARRKDGGREEGREAGREEVAEKQKVERESERC